VQVFSPEQVRQFEIDPEQGRHSLPLTYSASEQFSGRHSPVEESSAYPSAQAVQIDVSVDVITVEQAVQVDGHDRHSPVSVTKYIPSLPSLLQSLMTQSPSCKSYAFSHSSQVDPFVQDLQPLMQE